MRKLVWIAVGLTLACAAGAYIVSGLWLLLLGVICLCAAIPVLFLQSQKARICGLMLLGCAIGFCWFWVYDAVYLSIARDYDGKTASHTIEITDYSYENEYGIGADGRVKLDGKSLRIRIYLYEDVVLKPGDAVTGEFKLRQTTQKQNSYRGEGIFLTGTAQEVQIQHCDRIPAKYFAAELRKDILTLIERLFPSDTFAFAKALLLGDSYDLDYGRDTAYQASGIRHVIAVSGLHVAILFSVVYLVAGRHRVLSALIGVPVLVLFAALAGLTPSVMRACIMQGLVLLALLCNREYDPPSALAAAVVLMLLYNPMTVTSVSFQLSVGCMVGIFLFSQRIKDYILRGNLRKYAQGRGLLAKLIRLSVSGVAVTFSAMIVTTPLGAWYFGAVSLVGAITNLLCLWVISYIFCGIMASCVIGALWLPAGKVIAWLISWLIRYVDVVAEAMSAIPYAAVYTCSGYIVIWLLFCYGLLYVFWKSKKKHPIVLGACITVGLCCALLASWLEPRLDPYRLTVFDVGQGQCILFQCDGKNYLVDCGGDHDKAIADKVSQKLLSQGISKLDGAIVTHYDRDHSAAMSLVLQRLDVEKLYLPDISDDGPIRQNLSSKFSDKVCWVNKDKTVTFASFQMKIFATTKDTGNNESALCILFQTENCDILITSDRGLTGEQELLSHGELPQLELLVVGHHGSATSTGSELLIQTRPKNAVISVGENNYFNHPSQKVLSRLKRFDIRVWRTDLHGTILFRG